MRYVSYIIIIILILLGITFAVLNSDKVTVHYYAGQRDLPLSLLMALSFAIGILFGFLVMLPKIFRHRFNARRLRKKLKHAEEEIENLRKMPVKDDHL